jgi:hypothetical protein
VPRIDHVERLDFLQNRWPYLYELGEHVSFIEPTGQGKTHLNWQMVAQVLPAYQDAGVRYVSLMPKPKDPPTVKWAARLNMKIIPAWPPPARFPWQEKPAGYVLWPPHVKGDPKANREQLAAAFRPALNEQYWKGSTITNAHDTYILAVMLDLNPECEEFWTSGQAMPSGLWAENQKPSGTVGQGSVSSFIYNAPTHLILGHDPDMRNQKRFSEIGGVDPRLVSEIVSSLKIHPIQTPYGVKNISEKLYLCKRGYMCTVGI